MNESTDTRQIRSYAQCCFPVLGPSGYGNYIAWKGAAEAKGMNPNECHRWAVETVEGRPYCRQHAERQKRKEVA